MGNIYLSSRIWYQHLAELEGITKEASPAAKYIIDALWDIRHDPSVEEELKQYMNSIITEDRKNLSVFLG